jgi:predicted TIM-barrel fold metal-dependent hydrolase
MRTITLEEHYVAPGLLEGPGREFLRVAAAGPRMTRILSKLRDLNTGRIAEMDVAGIDVQVLFLNSRVLEQAGLEASALAREANDFVAAAARRRLTRSAGFAAAPLADPQRASDELERAVRDYGFNGADRHPSSRPLPR